MIGIYKITDEISKGIYVGYSRNIDKVLSLLEEHYLKGNKPATNKLYDIIRERGNIKGLTVEVLERIDGNPSTDILQARKAHYITILQPSLNTSNDRKLKTTSPVMKLTELIVEQSIKINELTRQVEELTRIVKTNQGQ